jgi:tetratricopeptide (TPR) repeat protein
MKKEVLISLSFLILIIFALSGCKPDPKKEIRELEAELASDDFVFDDAGIKKAELLISKYTAFADANQDDPDAPAFMQHAAEISLNLNKFSQSLEWYNRIIYQYPDYVKTPECLFMVAFIYENHLQNLGRAKELYESFIDRYPNHELADDAEVCIRNLGKSPEELLREFEQQNAQSGV